MNSLKASILFIGLIFSASVHSQKSHWTISKESVATNNNPTNAVVKEEDIPYKNYSLNFESFKAQLNQVTSRNGVASDATTILEFPNIKGELETFSVTEIQVMAPEVALEFPNIKTYVGYGIDVPGSRIRFSVSPQGLQTMTTYLDGPNVYTVPRKMANTESYIVYSRGAGNGPSKNFECLTEASSSFEFQRNTTNRFPDDQLLRTFRIAISTTGEYTQRWDDGNDGNGDAKVDAMAQLVSTLNRSNEVFETDMAIRFLLVSGSIIIYDNPATDPYDATDSDTFNGDLQQTLTTMVGEAAYDIGHLFHFGGNNGNAGCIGCVCEDGRKGSGFSSHRFLDNDGGPYMSDFFDIDYVPHEIGHQMGANHTWAFLSEGTGVNYEPGSGTTIMGYAGITNSDDVQDHSDPYFHYASIDQILTNVTASPNNCWTSSPISSNSPPVADAGPDYVIPPGTAFVLKGAATDADAGDILTYTWEQIDNGVSDFSNFAPDRVTGSLFRSRPPSTNPNRYMPTLSRIIEGRLTETSPAESSLNDSWETVATVTRGMNFALVVRDNARGKGKLPQASTDAMSITVLDSGSAFEVTSQTSAEVWESGQTQNVTWNVAGTDIAVYDSPNVNILLSIDGGLTFPYTLASSVPNDGSHDITVPTISVMESTTARIIVESSTNIFFAMNSTNFTVQNTTASTEELFLSSFKLYPNPSSGMVNLSFDAIDSKVDTKIFDVRGVLIKDLSFNDVGAKFSERLDLSELSAGIYILKIANGRNSVSKKILLE